MPADDRTMRLKSARVWLGIAVLLGAAAAGFAWVQPYAPERLRGELEVRLSELLHGPVRISELRLSLGWGLRLVGNGVEAWPGDGGAALRVARVTAELRPFAVLTGQRYLRLLRLEEPTLLVSRAADGQWSPPPAATLLGPRPDEPDDAQPDEWLRPLVALETVARALLAGSLVADRLELRHGTVLLSSADAAGMRSARLEGIQGRLARRWWGDTHLRLRGRLADSAQGDRGGFELLGDLQRRDELELAVALEDLDLAALRPWLRELRPGAELGGRLSGGMSFTAPQIGRGRLELDAVARDLESRLPDEAPDRAGPQRLSRLELTGALAISPETVRVEALRLATEPFSLELDGSLGRPLRPESPAELAVTLRGASLVDLRHVVGWLPEIRREEASGILAPLEEGRITLLRIGGADSVSGWQAFLAGRTRHLPRGFVVDARLEDTTLRVGDSDRLEQLAGRLWWTGDRLEIRGATALLNDNPLPRLDLSLEGVSHLFATDPAARRRQPGAQPLPGLRALWRALADGSGDTRGTAAPVLLELERLDHPIFFWPLEGLTAQLVPVEGGVEIETSGGTLAGAPLSGKVQWLFEPEARVSAHLRAEAPVAREPVALEPGTWLRGRFETAELEAGAWRQRSAAGRLRGAGASLELLDTEIALLPHGHLRGHVRLDLSRPETAGFEVDYSVEDGDVQALGTVLGLPPELATGVLSSQGSLTGELGPRPVAATLSGSVGFEARAGTISRSVPAVMAVALASEMVNPFARKERVRYDRVAARIELEQGRLHSQELTLEGPDVRAVASGGVDLTDPSHPLDVEVVLFLFRPVDMVLEKIPVVNFILLGENENLIAAHFALRGPWADPDSHMIPHRSFTSGPGSLVFERLPHLVRRGFEALDSLFSRGRVADQPPAKSTPASGG
jgi:hypothetical protein